MASVAPSIPAAGAAALPVVSPAPSVLNPFLWAHYQVTHFVGGEMHQWMCDSPHIPLLVAAVYISVVHAGPRVLPRLLGSKPMPGLNTIVAAWNLFFSIASTIGFCYCAPNLFRVLTMTDRELPGLAPKKDRVTGVWDMQPHVRGGLFTSLCYWNRNIFEDGTTAFWLVTFNLSKIPELMDTVFLLLKNKPVPFIHWYHHVSVMLFCWHAHVSGISNGLGFAVMNLWVHSIMYFYYFMCACGQRKLVRPFAAFVTLLQIAQMFTGMTLILYTTYLYIANPGRCDTTVSSLAFGMGMYFSYIVLFVKLFRDNYILKKRDRRERRRDGKIE